MEKEYWLYIDNYVYISAKKGNVLFYNSYTGKILEYRDNEIVFKLTRRLLLPRCRHVIRLTGDDICIPEVKKLVTDLREHFMGDILDTSYSKSKPFQAISPRIKIQKDIEHTKIDPSRSGGENIMSYLSEVTIYLNDSCNQACSFCNSAYRQVLCCTAEQMNGKYMNIEVLKKILFQIRGCTDIKVHIIGGDVFSVPYLKELPDLFIHASFRPKFYTHYLNVIPFRNKIRFLGNKNSYINLLVTFPIERKELEAALVNCLDSGRQTGIVFIVRDETEYRWAEEQATKLAIDNLSFIPIYDGTNLDFFEKHVFIDRNDIESTKPSLRDIHVNSKVNSWCFGKIIVLPNGDVHADINAPKLGNIQNDSINNAVVNEMNGGMSWWKKRKTVHPCRDCNFEKLCPPISGYNLAIGKYNMCHISL